MNKNIVLLLILINTCSYSQESEQYLKFKSDPEYQEAYILTLDSIKIKGLLKPKTMSEQLSVLNFVHPDGTRKKYHPADIKGYGYSVFNFISIDDTFFRIIMTGKKVNLYKEVIPARTVATTPMPGAAMGGTMYSDEKINFYVRKPGEKGYTKVSKKKFKDNFSEYFAECEKLKIKILNGELTYKDIESIVRQYNYCY